MNRFLKVLEGVGQGVSVYLFTVLGVLLAQFAPMLLAKDPITAYQWIRLGISAVVALYIVMQDEANGDPVGKAKNFKWRLSSAFKEGFLWNGMLGIAGQAAGQ